MAEYISREAAIAYIREQSEECQKAFEELGGASGIYADAYNDSAEDFCSIPAADVVPVVRCRDCKYSTQDRSGNVLCGHPEYDLLEGALAYGADHFCAYGERRDNHGTDIL